MSASPWFTGLVKEDLQHLHGDGSASLVANEDDSIDWSVRVRVRVRVRARVRVRVRVRAGLGLGLG